MDSKSIIQYAKMLKKNFKGLNALQIAEKLSYKVVSIPIDPDFIVAHNYRYKNGRNLIFINSCFDEQTKNVLCAHELGHAILKHPLKNEYTGKEWKWEHEATLFAVSLLFDEEDFNTPFEKMPYYVLKGILDKNISR